MGLKEWLSLDFSKRPHDAPDPPSPTPSRKTVSGTRSYQQQQRRQSSVRGSYHQHQYQPNQQQFGVDRSSDLPPLSRRASTQPTAATYHRQPDHQQLQQQQQQQVQQHQQYYQSTGDQPYQSESGYFFEENGVDEDEPRASIRTATRGGYERASSVYREAREDRPTANQLYDDGEPIVVQGLERNGRGMAPRSHHPAPSERMSFNAGASKQRRASYMTQHDPCDEPPSTPQERHRSSIFDAIRFSWLGGKHDDNDTRLSQLAIDAPHGRVDPSTVPAITVADGTMAPPNDQAEIVMQGWLEKCGQQFKTWNWRFFVLRADGGLAYYADEQAKKFKGLINFGYGSKADISMQSNMIDKKYVFMIATAQRNMMISAPSQKMMTKWIAKLHAAGATPSEPWDPSKKTVKFFVKHSECPHEWKRYDDPTSYIHMEGCLMKRGHINTNWKNRFFRIERGELRYYSENQDELKGFVPLTGTIVSPGMTQSPDGHKNYFVLTSNDGKFEMHLTAPNEQSMHRWIEALQEAQSALGGNCATDTVSGLALVVKQAEEIPLAKEEVVYEAPELINVELERRMEALIVVACRSGTVPLGSQLIAVGDRSILRESYTAARHALRSAVCPLQLHFLVPPYRKGELIKKSRSGFENWKRRVVVLTNGELQYYKQVASSSTDEKKALKHRNSFPLYGCYLNLIQMPGRQFCIIVARSPTDKLVLEARNDHERIEWASVIYCTIRMVSQGVTPGHIENLQLEVARDVSAVRPSDLDGSFKRELQFSSSH